MKPVGCLQRLTDAEYHFNKSPENTNVIETNHETQTDYDSSNPSCEICDNIAFHMANCTLHAQELKRKGLFTLRRLASWHSNILLPQLHDICLAVTQEVNNLRSKVARSAMRTLSEVFKAVGRNVDPEVEELTRVLLLKTGDTSEFLRDTAEKAMSILVENASPGRMLSALIATGAAQRNSIVRSCAAEHMLTTVESLGPERLLTGVRDGPDVILQTMVKLAQDGHQDTRFYGRRMLITFMAHPEFDRIIQRSLSTHDLHFGIRDSISEPPSAKVRHSFRGSFSASTLEATVPGRCEDPQLPIKSMRRRSSILKPNSDLRRTDADTLISPNGISARKQQDDIPQQNLLRQAVVRSMECTEKLKELQRLLTSREYQDRMHGVTLLLRISTDNTGLITANIQKILDWFIPRLQDSNKKVNLLALETASELVPLLADSLNPVLSGITTATIDNLNSKHPGTSYARKPQAVERYILPALWYLLANMTGNGILPGGCGNIRPVVLQLVLSLQQQMGSGLQESASSQTAHVQATLQELLKVEKPEEQCSSVET
ncbi:TGRM2 protein, partial [Polypterus senegalus]